MRIKKTVTIGTVGAGYPAYLHGNGIEKVGGVDVRLKTICDTNLELAQKVMDRYGYEQMTPNFDELLADPDFIQMMAGNEQIKEAVLKAHMEEIRKGGGVPQMIGAGSEIGKTPVTGRKPITGMEMAKKRLEAMLR